MKKWWITYELDFYNPGEEPKGRPSPFPPVKTCGSHILLDGEVEPVPRTAFYAGEEALRTVRRWIDSGLAAWTALASAPPGLIPDIHSLRVIKAEERE
jgi:hypothetical protein